MGPNIQDQTNTKGCLPQTLLSPFINYSWKNFLELLLQKNKKKKHHENEGKMFLEFIAKRNLNNFGISGQLQQDIFENINYQESTFAIEGK